MVFDSFWDRFLDAFWLVVGSTFGAFGGQKFAKMSSKIDAKIGIEKSRFRGVPIARNLPRLVAGGGTPLKVRWNFFCPGSPGRGSRFCNIPLPFDTLFLHFLFFTCFGNTAGSKAHFYRFRSPSGVHFRYIFHHFDITFSSTDFASNLIHFGMVFGFVSYDFSDLSRSHTHRVKPSKLMTLTVL